MVVRLAVNVGIRSTADPNYSLGTGMAGAALSGAIGGIAAPEAVLAKLLISGVASAAGSFLNAATEGVPLEQALKAGERGFYRGLATGLLGAGIGQTGRLGLRGEDFIGLGRAATSAMTASAGAALAGSGDLSQELFLSLRKPAAGSELEEGFQFVNGQLILVLPPGN